MHRAASRIWQTTTASELSGREDKRMRDYTRHRLIELTSLLLIIVVAVSMGWGTERERTIVRVIDGDTLELDGGERVRLIGVDTPEKFESAKMDRNAQRSGQDKKTIRELGELASQFTKSLCEGKRCWLEYDTQLKDKYGRTLAYVHLEGGTVVNEEIIRQGYGNAYTRFPFRDLEKYRELEAKARKGRCGLWR